MFETMEDAGGVGLAAPQVHVPLRLFVFTVPEGRRDGEDDPPVGHSVLINPVIEPVGGDERNTGRLPVDPRLRGLVRRPPASDIWVWTARGTRWPAKRQAFALS